MKQLNLKKRGTRNNGKNIQRKIMIGTVNPKHPASENRNKDVPQTFSFKGLISEKLSTATAHMHRLL